MLKNNKQKIAVLGAGSWGTALANHLSLSGFDTILWGKDSQAISSIQSSRINQKYFPDYVLAKDLIVTDNLQKALDNTESVVFSVPSTSLRDVSKQAKPFLSKVKVIISTAKGLEENSLKRMSEVLFEEIKMPQIAVLSGPSFAKEVILNLPTAVTIASVDKQAQEDARVLFHHRNFRVYTSSDVVGVEYGGVIKNIFALAVGVIYGSAMGDNARAALLTRGLSEMSVLVQALGGKAQTVLGLSCLGDLLLTSTGDKSRNRQVGLRLGKGESLDSILSDLGQVAEGVKATKLVVELAKRKNIETPLISEMNRLLTGTSTVQESVSILLSRSPKSEF